MRIITIFFNRILRTAMVISMGYLVIIPPDQASAAISEMVRSNLNNENLRIYLKQMSRTPNTSKTASNVKLAHCCQPHSSYPYNRHCCHSASVNSLTPSYPSQTFTPSYGSRSLVPSYEPNRSSVRGSSREFTDRTSRRSSSSFPTRR